MCVSVTVRVGVGIFRVGERVALTNRGVTVIVGCELAGKGVGDAGRTLEQALAQPIITTTRTAQQNKIPYLRCIVNHGLEKSSLFA